MLFLKDKFEGKSVKMIHNIFTWNKCFSFYVQSRNVSLTLGDLEKAFIAYFSRLLRSTILFHTCRLLGPKFQLVWREIYQNYVNTHAKRKSHTKADVGGHASIGIPPISHLPLHKTATQIRTDSTTAHLCDLGFSKYNQPIDKCLSVVASSVFNNLQVFIFRYLSRKVLQFLLISCLKLFVFSFFV